MEKYTKLNHTEWCKLMDDIAKNKVKARWGDSEWRYDFIDEYDILKNTFIGSNVKLVAYDDIYYLVVTL